MDLLTLIGTGVTLLAGTAAFWKWVWPKLLMPLSRRLANAQRRHNSWLHKRRLGAIRRGARLPCYNSDCDRIVSSVGEQTFYCDECARAVVKQIRDERLRGLPAWWASQMRCLSCGHKFHVVCPKCNAPGLLPVPLDP